MLISIVMSVYNGEDYISSAVECILNQIYQNFEFIIIDDGSTDHSYELLHNHANKDKRIKIFKNPKKIGLTKSLNKAIKLSRGVFIARQDVDDISVPERLEKQLEFLQNHSEYAFCGSDVRIKDGTLSFINYFNFADIKKNLIIENCFAHPTIFIRKHILEKYGYYDENYIYGQDFELWCRLIYKYKLKAINLQEKLVVLDNPFIKITEKNRRKLIIQWKNQILTSLKYIKYVKKRFRVLKSISELFLKIIYILLFSKNK